MFRTELENAMAKDGGGALPMLVGGREVLVSGVGQPSGTPKADFFLLDDKGETQHIFPFESNIADLISPLFLTILNLVLSKPDDSSINTISRFRK